VIVIYCGYGDESTDDAKNRVYAVGAVFGQESDYVEIKKPWQNRLGGRIFHSADLEHGRKDFADLKPGEGRKLYKDLVSIVCGSKLIGEGIAINITEYRKEFPNDHEDAPYLWLFGDAVSDMSDLASLSVPPSPVEVTFDRNQENEYNATLLYELIRRSKRTGFGKFLADKVSFATRKTFGVQLADLFAREAMKRLNDQITPNNRPARVSFSRLSRAQRMRFRVIGWREFQEKKQTLMKSTTREVGNMRKYREWLNLKRIQDCQSNRIHYIEAHAKEFGYERLDNA
jgi:hypothetical protein